MKPTTLTIAFAILTCSVHGFAQEPEPLTGPAPEVVPPAPAPYQAEAPRSNDLGSKRDFFKITGGVRVGFVADRALDPFATSNALAGVSLGASRTLLHANRLALAAGVAYDGGGREDDARGVDAGLAWHRLTVPIEGRYHLLPLLYGFARVAPGAHFTTVRMKDASAQSALSDDGWSFATDLSVGASVLVGPHVEKSKARFWITPELGYMATTALALALTPTDRDDPRRVVATKLGSLGMNGPFLRVTADISF